jgi:hypothetical protein
MDTQARAVAEGPVDWDAIKVEYEAKIDTLTVIAAKYHTSRSAISARARRDKWKPRSPKRVDRADLIERMLRLIENETEALEGQMTNKQSTGNEAATLNRLANTLDKLISLQAAEKRPPRRRATKAMQDIRKKVADRLTELNGK